MLTFNQVIDTLRDIADAHYQIQSFGFGNIWDVEEKDRLSDSRYPMMFSTTRPGRGSKGVLEVNLTLLFLDLVKTDRSNVEEVISDQLLIALDVVAQLKAVNTNLNIADGFSFDDIDEKYTRDVAGIKVDLAIRLPWNADRCQVPTTVISTGSGSCPVVTIYQADGTTVETTIPAGGSYTLEASGPATVRNSDSTYSQSVASGGTLVLTDTTYNVNVNGVFNQTATVPAMVDTTLNIS